MAANRTKAAADRRGAPSDAAEELGDIRKKLDEIRNTLRGLGAPESTPAPASRPVAVPAKQAPAAQMHDEPELGGEVARLVEQIRQRNEQTSPAPHVAPQAAQPSPTDIWETGGLASAIKEIEARRAALDAERPRAPKPAVRQPARAQEAQDNPWPVLQRMEGRLEALGSMMERTATPAAENDAFKMLAEHTARIEAILGDSPKTPQLRTLQTQIRSLGTRLDEVANATPSAAAFATLETSVVEIGQLLADSFPAGGFKGLTTQLTQFDERVKTLESRPDKPEGLSDLEQQIAGIQDILRLDDRSERLAQIEEDFLGIDTRLTGLAHTAAERTAVEQLAGRLDQVSAKVDQRSLQPIEEALAGLTRSSAADRTTVQQLASRIEEVSAKVDQRSLQPVEEAIEALQGRLDGLTSLFESSALASGDRENIRQIEGRMGLFETRLDRFESLVPSAGALDALEQKLEEISRAIAERPHAQEDPAVGRLETQLAELATRVDAMNGGATTARPLEELEAHIARLGAQIEANETRFGKLGPLDGTVENLMAVVERSREEATLMAREAANEAVKAALASREDNPQTDMAIEALRESLQELHRTTQGSETRRLDALGGLQDSLSKIVDRLGALEMELGEPRSSSSRAEKADARRVAVQSDRRPEPEAGRSDGFMLQAAMMAPRAPEAALDDAGSTRADFIAAARRAARHAVEPAAESAERRGEPGDEETEVEGTRRAGRLKSLLQQKRRSIALATAAILLVIGTLQLQGLLGDRIGGPATPEGKVVAATVPAQLPSTAVASATADVRRASSLTQDMTFSAPSATLARFETQGPGAVEARGGAPEAPSPSVGSELLRNAAASGDARAQYEIGVRYTDGKVVSRDLTEAARWYEHAAAQGLAPAQYRLGNLLEKGMGRPKDLGAARGWYEKAAKAGNRMAMHNLGVLSAEGAGAKPDYAAAIGWFREAADHGVRDSQFNLGVIYARGLGTAQDLVESYKWFAVLSTSGDPEATRKRDEVASRLAAEDREKARATADAFRGKPVLAEANDVSAPEGGWDAEPAKPTVMSSLAPETGAAPAGGVKTERLLTQQVQALLVERGFDPGPSDGVPGRKTRDAIRAFERTTGLPETGQVTPGIFYKLAASS